MVDNHTLHLALDGVRLSILTPTSGLNDVITNFLPGFGLEAMASEIRVLIICSLSYGKHVSAREFIFTDARGLASFGLFNVVGLNGG